MHSKMIVWIVYFKLKYLFQFQMRASSFYSKMRFKMEMSQTHFGPSQNGNGDQNDQKANLNRP